MRGLSFTISSIRAEHEKRKKLAKEAAEASVEDAHEIDDAEDIYNSMPPKMQAVTKKLLDWVFD